MSAAPWLLGPGLFQPESRKNMNFDESVRQAPRKGNFARKSAWILTAYYTSSYHEKAKK